MQLQDIMSRNLITCAREETIAVAARKMREANIGCLVVTNSGTVLGIITDRDLAVNCIPGGHQAQQCQVANHMSNPVITASPSMDIIDAAKLMNEKMVKRLPVVESGQLVGLVSFSDISQALAQPMHDLMMGMGAARRAPARHILAA